MQLEQLPGLLRDYGRVALEHHPIVQGLRAQNLQVPVPSPRSLGRCCPIAMSESQGSQEAPGAGLPQEHRPGAKSGGQQVTAGPISRSCWVAAMVRTG